MLAININTGKEIWSHKIKSKNELGDLTYEDKYMICSDQGSEVFTIPLVNPKKYDNITLENKIKNTIYCYNNCLYYIDNDGYLCAVKYSPKD